MAETTTITVRVTAETKVGLDRIAELTKRSRSYLAAAALALYVDDELRIVEGIQAGIDDVKAGRVVPHKEAMQRLRTHVKKVAAASRKKSA